MNTATTSERNWIPGIILIVVGITLLAAQWFERAGGLVLGGLAFMFLALYVGTRKDGFLVPGAILAGLAIGVGLEENGYTLNGSVVVLGLAGGFLAIYVIDMLFGSHPHWWPLIPGGILAIVGGSQAIGGTEAQEIVSRWWPAVLIVVGVIVLFARQRQLKAPRSNTPTVYSENSPGSMRSRPRM